RVLCRPGTKSRTRRSFLWTAPRGTVLATYPDRLGLRQPYPPSPKLGRAHGPYSVLLLAGLAMPSLLPGTRWALTPPFHPYPSRRGAVCFLWRYPWGHPRRALPAAMSSWSPDFPRPP